MRGSTIFLTGGTSGIGKGLAEAFHERGNQVIVTSRREERLKELCRQHPGMRYFVLDVTDSDAIRRVARQAIGEFPEIGDDPGHRGLPGTPAHAAGRRTGKSVPDSGSGCGPMPLDTFIAETMKELETGAEEVAIGTAKNLIAAAGADTFKQAFSRMNE